MTLADVADENGWKEDQTFIGARGTWMLFRQGDVLVEVWRDRWRHSTARAYRGNALMAMFRGQRAVAEFMSGGEP